MKLKLPISVLTDSYKAGHPEQYPDTHEMSAYGEFRISFDKDPDDNRFVFYGIRYFVETYLHTQWTVEDVEKAEKFYSTHNAGKTPYPFPKDLFLKFINENDGYFPIKLEALPDGSVAHCRVPVYQITASGPYAKLVTFMETLLTHVWYPSTVATLSRRVRDIIDNGFKESVDEELNFLAEYKLHDFGFRGCTCLEQSVQGGSAHLLNFLGTDTMSAAYYVQFELNDGRPVAESIPATEHSVMTAWPNEAAAIRNMINKYGGENKLFACVMDSYDYQHAITQVLHSVLEEKKNKGGTMVIRPDSGDPIETVLMGLRAADDHTGHVMNKKGFKMLNGFNVIQGDGLDYNKIKQICDAVIKEGYSLANVTFGMGAGLLQKVNRDTMSFATKLNYIEYGDGRKRDVMKKPTLDSSKYSLPGKITVRKVNGIPIVFPLKGDEKDNMLKVVYDCGPVKDAFTDDFDTIRKRVGEEWNKLPRYFDPISEEMKEKIKAFDVPV